MMQRIVKLAEDEGERIAAHVLNSVHTEAFVEKVADRVVDKLLKALVHRLEAHE